ncbi:MAG TPA: Ig-like domain-containing protein, partial [Anaerolineales bacterium]|nr:Ig-like domain-containing protein [Anaerolineales bacterium]
MANERRTKRPTTTTGGGILTKEEWRRFDLSKLWVWIVLVALAIILMLLRGCNPQAAAPLATATSAATAAPTTEPTAVAASTNTPVPPEPTFTPAAVASAPAIDPQDGVIPAGPVTFSGTAAPGAELDIQVDGVSVGTAIADADGRWSMDVDLAAGDHEVVVVAPDDAGGASAPQAFQIGS